MKKYDGKEKRQSFEQEVEQGSVSRRGFLKTGLGLGALATASGLPPSTPKKGAHAAQFGTTAQKMAETYDVVVIGSGVCRPGCSH